MRPALFPLLLLLVVVAGVALAEQAPPGASTCLGCHSATRTAPAIPALRGREAAEIAAAMRDFREGRRQATLMDRLAKGFSEEESQAIAAWVVR